jgi:hypothetical protein
LHVPSRSASLSARAPRSRHGLRQCRLRAGRCGGGGQDAGAEPADWIEDVCTALVAWRDDLEAASEDLQATASGSANLDEALSLLTSFLDDAVARTDEMLADVAAAGTPAVDEGEAISADLQAALPKTYLRYATYDASFQPFVLECFQAAMTSSLRDQEPLYSRRNPDAIPAAFRGGSSGRCPRGCRKIKLGLPVFVWVFLAFFRAPGGTR